MQNLSFRKTGILGASVAVAMVFGLVAGCTKKDNREGGKASEQKKVLHEQLDGAIKGFDPATADDVYTNNAVILVYEGLVDYHYLNRPLELKPLLASAMPTISKDGRTYTFPIRKDVYFHDDPAFKGQKRQMTAHDIVYSFKRVADPRIKSNLWWVLRDRVEGLNAFRKAIQDGQEPSKRYEKEKVAGLYAKDDFTLVIKLNQPDRQFIYVLAMGAPLSVVAPEVVEHYGEDFLNHPVGTGPFKVKEWIRGQKIVYEKNADYRKETYPTEGEAKDQAEGLLADAGKQLPLVDEFVYHVYVETQPRWLNFLKGNLDLVTVPKESFAQVVDEDKQLKEKIRKKGIVAKPFASPDLVYYSFNMDDPVIGKNIYLRQAMSLAFDRHDKIRIFYNDRAVLANGPVPPGLGGYDPNQKDPWQYDLKKAKEALEKAKKLHKALTGEDELPPIQLDAVASATARQWGDHTRGSYDKIGLKVTFNTQTWPQYLQKLNKGQFQFGGSGWRGDYPDAENFLQLFYGPHRSPGSNHCNFDDPEYNKKYEAMKNLPDGPERSKLIREMIDILHQQVPAVFLAHRLGFPLQHKWLRNYKPDYFMRNKQKYLDVDLAVKAETKPKL